MILSEEALQALRKNKLINLPLEYQKKFNSTLANIDKDTGRLRKIF